MLRQAIASGYKDAGHLERDTDFDSLRGRPDFKKLLEKLRNTKGNGARP
jgi:hypothetical protein